MKNSGQHCGAETKKKIDIESKKSMNAAFLSINRNLQQMYWMMIVILFMLSILLIC